MTKETKTFVARIDIEPFTFEKEPLEFEELVHHTLVAAYTDLKEDILDLKEDILKEYRKQKESNDASS